MTTPVSFDILITEQVRAIIASSRPRIIKSRFYCLEWATSQYEAEFTRLYVTIQRTGNRNCSSVEMARAHTSRIVIHDQPRHATRRRGRRLCIVTLSYGPEAGVVTATDGTIGPIHVFARFDVEPK